MKKLSDQKKRKNTGTIDVNRLIKESGVDLSSSATDRIMVSADIFKKLTLDIYQLGYLNMESCDELEFILDRFFSKQIEAELGLC